MILGTKLVVHEQDRDFGTCNDHNEVDNQSESKDIVELVHPQTCHDKEKFDIGRHKGNDTGKHHTYRGLQKEIGRRRDRASNCTGNGREFNRLGLVSKVGTQKDERNGNTAPHSGDNKNVQKGCTGT